MSRDPTFTSAPSRSRRLLPGCAIFSCGCAVVILLLIGGVAAWVCNYNRNPNPFPLEPETAFDMPGIPMTFEFLDPGETVLVLCVDHARGPTSTVLAKCDVGSGTVIGSRQLPFLASRMALSPSGELAAVAGIALSLDKDHTPVPPHTTRMLLLNVRDLSVVAETEEPFPAQSLDTCLAESLRVVPVPGRKAWVLGSPARDGESYTLSLRDDGTLAEMASESFVMPRNRWLSAIVAVSPNNPSSLLVGRLISSQYQWDTWVTDTGEHTSYAPAVGDGLPNGYVPSGVTGAPHLAMPNQGTLPQIAWTEGCRYAHFWGCAEHSTDAQLFACAGSWEVHAEYFSLYSRDNKLRSRIEIRSFPSWQEIAAGELWGEANQVTALRISPGGQRLVTGHRDGTVRIWNLAPTAR
jgi:hypothetical protein